jgi:hypothetical protein
MSADNFFFIRKDGRVEDRKDSFPDVPGTVVYEGNNVEDAETWVRDQHRIDPLITEYGWEIENDNNQP